jgi:hypothetical protein
LDLWEEEDAEDGRPTIVSERPTAAPNGKATKASDKTIPFGTIGGDRKTPEVQRSGLVQRLIEQGALEDELSARNSSEELRDSEIDLLKLPPDPDDATVVEPTIDLVVAARSTAADTPRGARVPRLFEGVETEPATDDQVPTVSVKRPLPPLSVELQNVATMLPGKAAVAGERVSFDREVTERISIPSGSGMVGSIAPTTRTFRPAASERKGMPFWQTALAALVLLGGGISIAKFQAEQRNQTGAVSSQPSSVSEQAQAVQPVEPAVLAAPPTAKEMPAPPPGSAPAVATRPAAEVPEQALKPASVPTPATIGPMLPLPKRDDAVVPVSRTRRTRERTAIASAETEPEVVSPAQPVKPPAAPKPEKNEVLPDHPSREQVTSSLNSVSSELKRCVGDRHGVADVTVTVRSAGFVSYAVVSGAYAGTPEGSCIARAVRAAKFPAFSEPTLRVTYPFQL